MKRKLGSYFLALTMLLSFMTYGAQDAYAADAGDSWSIYWYLCGSDLESENGCATMDLQEMLDVELPENVNVIIQTGGAEAWQNELMNPEKIQRWLFNSEGMYLLEEQNSANMGDAQTLANFLSFASTNYPADKTAVIFWNHGGGSVSGAAFDQIYGNDSLDLSEMYAAFDAVWGADANAPALELVGFDTCLMATIDVAAVFQNFAHYLVASEETEPGNGWYYTGWLGALATDPSMDGAKLGKAICDAYYAGCEAVGTEDQTTLSLTDLTKLDPLLDAYEAFGQEAMVSVAANPGFYSEFARAAISSENYGGNNDEEGYTNMVDLGHLARQTAGTMKSSKAVLDALNNCVLYRVNGDYRAEATGLSCYYSYNGDVDDYNAYTAVGAGEAFKHFYGYALTGDLDQNYLKTLNITEMQTLSTLTETDWDGKLLDLNEDGVSILNLGPQASDILAELNFQLYYVDEENDQLMLLGQDNDIVCDWDNGVFYDNFRGVWGAIDGHLVYMELTFDGDDYNLYAVPVLLNGEAYNLQVAYDFSDEAWSILGASKGLDASGMASKELRLLKSGDKLTTLWKITDLSSDADFEFYQAEELTVTASTAFGEAPLSDGLYAMVYEMQDAVGNRSYSDSVNFTCTNGEIITTVGGEMVSEPTEGGVVLQLTIDQAQYKINGQTKTNDVAPIIKDGRTVLPIKLVAATLGAEVSWDQAAQAVTIQSEDTTIVLTIGKTTASVDGEAVELAVPAFIENGRTYLPVRFVSEYLGANVAWDDATRTVTITG